MTTYTTYEEAVQREIIEPLGEWVEDFDIEAIADEVIVSVGEGVNYRFTLEEGFEEHDTFWGVVAKHAL